tara:strand:+ start:359 stop:550 length:192 start_codon:yes stop_codon:yes gene_type:complete
LQRNQLDKGGVMKKKKQKRSIWDSGQDANTFYKRKAGAHDHKLTKRNKTRNKQGKIKKILEEY